MFLESLKVVSAYQADCDPLNSTEFDQGLEPGVFTFAYQSGDDPVTELSLTDSLLKAAAAFGLAHITGRERRSRR